MRPTFHFRKVEKSRILKRTYDFLKRGIWVTTLQIQSHTGSTRPASDVSEVRANGHNIKAVLDHIDARTGARVFRYRMLW